MAESKLPTQIVQDAAQPYRITSHLYKTGEGVDVECLVVPPEYEVSNPQARFAGHKLILSAASTALNALFTASLDKTILIDTLHGGSSALSTPVRRSLLPQITIPGVTTAAFAAILAYIYTGEITLNVHHAIDVYLAAKRYDLPSLASSCLSFLPKCLFPESTPMHLFLAVQHADDQLWRLLSAYTFEHFSEVSRTPGFLRLPVDVLLKLLSEDRSIDETALFASLLRWARFATRRTFNVTTSLSPRMFNVGENASHGSPRTAVSSYLMEETEGDYTLRPSDAPIPTRSLLDSWDGPYTYDGCLVGANAAWSGEEDLAWHVVPIDAARIQAMFLPFVKHIHFQKLKPSVLRSPLTAAVVDKDVLVRCLLEMLDAAEAVGVNITPKAADSSSKPTFQRPSPKP